MFKIGSTESYSWPVKIILPADDGKTLEQDFTAIFRRVKQSEIDDFFAMLEAGKMTDRQIVQSVLIGWKNIVDDSANQIPYSESLRDQILEGAGVATQIGAAFLSSLKAGRVKN